MNLRRISVALRRAALPALAALALATAPSAHAQLIGDPHLWSFDVPDGLHGGNLVNTVAPDDYWLSPGQYTVNVSNSAGFYGGGVYQKNVYNVLVDPAANTDFFYAYTHISANFFGADDYPFASMAIIGDSENVVQLSFKHSVFGGSNVNYFAVESLLNSHYTDDYALGFLTGFSDTSTGGYVEMVGSQPGGYVEFYYFSDDGQYGYLGGVYAGQTGVYGEMYDFLSNIGGKRIGLYGNPQGSPTPDMYATFTDFSTNLPLVNQAAPGVPEPGAAAFGLLTCGSLAALIARRRRAK